MNYLQNKFWSIKNPDSERLQEEDEKIYLFPSEPSILCLLVWGELLGNSV